MRRQCAVTSPTLVRIYAMKRGWRGRIDATEGVCHWGTAAQEKPESIVLEVPEPEVHRVRRALRLRPVPAELVVAGHPVARDDGAGQRRLAGEHDGSADLGEA